MTINDSLLRMSKEEKGKFGERICKAILVASGVHYIPLCDLENGGAPMAVGGEGKVVLPDFDVIGGELSAYIDAKVKTQSIRYRKTGQVRHGINLRNYESYRRMGVLSKKQCGLFIIELLDDAMQWSGSILSESFAGLGEPSKGFNEPTPKVYWPRNRFNSLGSYSASELVDISSGRLTVTMESILKESFGPPVPRCSPSCSRDKWIDLPDRDARGWIKTVCAICGAFKGLRPPELAQQKAT